MKLTGYLVSLNVGRFSDSYSSDKTQACTAVGFARAVVLEGRNRRSSGKKGQLLQKVQEVSGQRGFARSSCGNLEQLGLLLRF